MEEIIKKAEELLSFLKRIEANEVPLNADSIKEIKETMDLLEDIIDTLVFDSCIEDYKNNALHIIK